MKRLLTIEWYKLKNHTPFWVFTGLYILILLLIFLSGKFFLDLLTFKGESIDILADPSKLPVYAFPDVWHNTAYIAGFFKIILAFYVILSISNEISFGTLRQNIMNGLSRKEFLASKILMILILGILSTVFLFITSLSLGLIYSPHVTLHNMIKYSGFVPAYFLQITCYMMMALFLGLLLKRTGLTMLILLAYTLIIEPIVLLRIGPEWIKNLFPVKAINNLIHFPFGKYLLRETQDYVAIQDIGIAITYLLLFILLISFILRKRDL